MAAKANVVFDSQFTNTASVAEVIAAALKDQYQVDLHHVSELEGLKLPTMGLLIVGSPTQKFSSAAAIKSFLNEISNGALERV